ncbi:MAG: hypothetical protein JWP12_2148 [Bacteroidetes bacterium]|nr:hypothetical protein [Bacteroidota bacterium]
MNTHLKHKVFFWISFILMFIQSQNEAFASHAQSADITYQCLGGNQYRINLSFYRDCAGVAAPNTVTINISSASCGPNFDLTLNQIPGTGTDVSPICSSLTSVCAGGVYPGVQEYKYTGVTTLPMACSDWHFSFSICCRNTSIGTILNPSSENMYIEAFLNNLDFPCNSSPTFSNPPIPFVCIGQPYCFNNGSSDIDGDSLSYTLITPETSATSTVSYIAPYSATQPLLSSPAVAFNPLTGDMCMTPTQLEVTVFTVLVKEWRQEVLVGSVMRDIQLRTMTCTNNNPYVNGINNSGQYSLTACAGVPINFNIPTYDLDSTQNVTITWNSGIAAGTFTSSGGARPTGTFSWTPSITDIGNASNCFTVTVRDDNCPFNGSQTFSFCISVTGVILNTVSTPDNCNASNGTATVQILSGSGPYTYQWLPSGGTGITAGTLAAGIYTINVTGSGGCTGSASILVASGAAPANVVINSTNVSCFGAGTGVATANVTGGLAPYIYHWSNGATTSSITSLTPGTYNFSVTTGNGCVTNSSVSITQPLAPITYSTSQVNVSCNGSANGSASIATTGGTAPYTYAWNTTPVQITPTATNLNAANYTATITDANGCNAAVTGITITQPAALNANAMIVHNVTCNGLADGFATVGASGGTGAYSYNWTTSPATSTQSVNALAPGNYFVTVTDANSCIATSFVTITEPPALTLSTAAFPVTCNGACNGQTVVIPAGGSPSYSYQWLPDGGTSPAANGLCPGTYTINVTDANGCSASSTLAVTQPAPVVVTATGGTTICLGQNTTIAAAASGGNPGYSYNWTGVGAGATQTVSPVSSSVYNVTATDANGCTSNTATLAITVTSLTAANLTVTGATAICYGNAAVIGSAVAGQTGPVTVSWSNSLGGGNGPFTVSPANSTNYIVTVTDACGNAVTGSVPVTVNPLPVIDIVPQAAVGCKEVQLNFTDHSPTNTGAAYNWDFGDGATASIASPVHGYTTTGVYNVTVIVTSLFGCVNTASVANNVTVNAGSLAQFTSEAMDGTTISPVYKFNNISVNAATYQWDFGDGATSTDNDPEHTYAQQGDYKVKLFTASSAGCLDSVSEVVQIKPLFTLYIPNAFTPDENGTNDYFTAKGDQISEFKMMIFDRWGELIFQTNDIKNGWNGTVKNGSKISENGVYVYKITVRDFEQRLHDYTGHVTLLAQQ